MRLQKRRRRLLVGDCEQHADALRRGEREVKRGDLGSPVLRFEPLAGSWIAAVHRAHDPLATHLPANAEDAGSGARPAARCLAPPGDVVLQALGNLLLVVSELVRRRAEVSDGQHGRRIPARHL
jgi:hypothetical protein